MDGDTITQKAIIITLNDDTNVKVLSGLSAEDEVITSALANDTKTKKDETQKSPFMPSMGKKKAAASPKN